MENLSELQELLIKELASVSSADTEALLVDYQRLDDSDLDDKSETRNSFYLSFLSRKLSTLKVIKKIKEGL